MFDADVVVAGGGPAGCAAAAALAELGHTVVVADAGVDRHRQLAGELLHPPAVDDLRALGFGPVLEGAAATSVHGFAVVDGAGPGGRVALLPYVGDERGLALEHSALTVPLLDALSARANVTVLRRTRVAEVHRNDAEAVELTLSGEYPQTLRARLLVAADGRASFVRKLLGISDVYTRLSTMLGVTVDSARLPFAGRGHLFIGGPAPVLAYAIGPNIARVMVDLPLGSPPDILRQNPLVLSGLPEPLKAEVLAALEREAPRMASNDTRFPEKVVVGRAVLIGDAAGCCHPLSASGIASSVRDGRSLATALRRGAEDIPWALQLYAQNRRPPQRTRIALASALYFAFTGQGDDMRALRGGLFRYWQNTRSGAAASMSLLSTREPRMGMMAREYLRVVGHGILGLASRTPRPGARRMGAAVGLLRSSWPHLREAVRGALEDFRLRNRPGVHALPTGEPSARSRPSASKS